MTVLVGMPVPVTVIPTASVLEMDETLTVALIPRPGTALKCCADGRAIPRSRAAVTTAETAWQQAQVLNARFHGGNQLVGLLGQCDAGHALGQRPLGQRAVRPLALANALAIDVDPPQALCLAVPDG